MWKLVECRREKGGRSGVDGDAGEEEDRGRGEEGDSGGERGWIRNQRRKDWKNWKSGILSLDLCLELVFLDLDGSLGTRLSSGSSLVDVEDLGRLQHSLPPLPQQSVFSS